VVALFMNIAVFVKLRSMVVWFFYILQEKVHVLTCRYEFCSILICFAFQFDGIYTCNKELPFELIRAYASSLF
jgi:hypothetical protein